MLRQIIWNVYRADLTIKQSQTNVYPLTTRDTQFPTGLQFTFTTKSPWNPHQLNSKPTEKKIKTQSHSKQSTHRERSEKIICSNGPKSPRDSKALATLPLPVERVNRNDIYYTLSLSLARDQVRLRRPALLSRRSTPHTTARSFI